MKYAIHCMLRFDSKTERDAALNTIKSIPKVLDKKFEHDDSFVQSHKCYHDEDPAKPCEPEERLEAQAAKK